MKHLEIRDLWLQKEVREVVIRKIPGTENPADLMTKILTSSDIEERLRRMKLEMVLGDGGLRCMVQVGEAWSVTE